MQVFADLLALGLRQGLAGDLHQIGAQLVLVAVDNGLRLTHHAEILVGPAVPQANGHQQVALGPFGHGVGHQPALLDGQRRVLQKALLQPVHLLLLGGGAVVGEQQLHHVLHQPNAGQQHDHGGQAEQGVHQCDGHRGHDRVQKGEVDNGVGAVEVGAQGGQQHRHRRADGDAHDDGQSHLKGDSAGNGQRLQNTHRGGGALQNAGERQAHQNT